MLEHVQEDGVGKEKLILEEIHRVLKPEGLFFIWNLPTMLGTSELAAIAARRWHHKRRYWKKEIIQNLRDARFKLLYFDKHKFLPGSALKILEKKIDPKSLMQLDNRISHVFPFNLFARDFAIVAQKAG